MGVPDDDSWLLRAHYPRAKASRRGWPKVVSIAILGTMILLLGVGLLRAVV